RTSAGQSHAGAGAVDGESRIPLKADRAGDDLGAAGGGRRRAAGKGQGLVGEVDGALDVLGRAAVKRVAPAAGRVAVLVEGEPGGGAGCRRRQVDPRIAVDLGGGVV